MKTQDKAEESDDKAPESEPDIFNETTQWLNANIPVKNQGEPQ